MRKHLLAGWLVFSPLTALAQPVTPVDLEHHVVEARLVMDQQIRREGREFPVQVHQQLRFVFRPEGMVEWEMTPTSHTPRGARPGPTQRGRVTLGKVVEARNLGGGQAIWFFEDGVLTTLRTYAADGGFKRTVSFTRDSKGLTCSLKALHMREDGVGRVAMRSAIDNAPVTVLSSKQSSSACKISKLPAT